MCGISGVLVFDNSRGSPVPVVERMNIQMHRRGPDAAGIYSSVNLALGHTRLSIQDLDPRANQPFLSECGRYALVFNGEIYNYFDLKKKLEVLGRKFRTTSDTEVLLSSYIEWGPSCLEYFEGMFAFAIWDDRAKELFIARDPHGIKPLYYAKTSTSFIFASQVKAIIKSGLVACSEEIAAKVGFLQWGSVPEPWTTIEGVFALEAGHYTTIGLDQQQKTVRWTNLEEIWLSAKERGQSPDAALTSVRESVLESMSRHLVADVPVCLFLSGGVDSAAIAGLCAQLGVDITAITLGFSEFRGTRDDEVPRAVQIAGYYGIKHLDRVITQREFQDDLEQIFEAMDQPTIDGINTWLISKIASKEGFKVALSGVGGDELFAGYDSFEFIPKAYRIGRALKPLRKIGLDTLGKHLAGLFGKPKLIEMPRALDRIEDLLFLKRTLFLQSEIEMILGVDAARTGLNRIREKTPQTSLIDGSSPISLISYLESVCYLRNQLLRDADWASMYHSIELRTPLVDYKLLRSLAGLIPHFSEGRGKYFLSKCPAREVPKSIIRVKKTGFSVPFSNWISINKYTRELPKTFNNSVNLGSWARQWALVQAFRDFR